MKRQYKNKVLGTAIKRHTKQALLLKTLLAKRLELILTAAKQPPMTDSFFFDLKLLQTLGFGHFEGEWLIFLKAYNE